MENSVAWVSEYEISFGNAGVNRYSHILSDVSAVGSGLISFDSDGIRIVWLVKDKCVGQFSWKGWIQAVSCRRFGLGSGLIL